MSNESDETTPAVPAAPPAPPLPADAPAAAVPPPPAPYGDGLVSPPAPPPPGYGAGPLPPPAAGTGPTATGKRSFLGSRVVRVVVGIALVLALTLGWSALRNRNSTASAPGQGSCLWAEGTYGKNPKIHKVACSDLKAEYIVLSKIAGGSESSCNSVAGTQAAYIAKTTDSKPAYVLCLQQTK